MKKNLLFFIILSNLLCNLFSSPNKFDSEYENINNVASFSNQFEYFYDIFNGMKLHYIGSFRKLDDNTWNRDSKQTEMSWFMIILIVVLLIRYYHN